MTDKEIIMEEALKRIRDDHHDDYDHRIVARYALQEVAKIKD